MLLDSGVVARRTAEGSRAIRRRLYVRSVSAREGARAGQAGLHGCDGRAVVVVVRKHVVGVDGRSIEGDARRRVRREASVGIARIRPRVTQQITIAVEGVPDAHVVSELM